MYIACADVTPAAKAKGKKVCQVVDSTVDSPGEAGDREGAEAKRRKKRKMAKKRQKAESPIDEEEPSTHQDRGDEVASPRKVKKEKGKGKKAKKRQGSERPSAQQDRSAREDCSAGDDYWDEEDELEEYIMKRDLGQIREHSTAGNRSDSSGAESEPLRLADGDVWACSQSTLQN